MPVTERNGSIAMLNELADFESRINIYQTSLRKSTDASSGSYEETVPVKKRNNTFQSVDSKTNNSSDVLDSFPKTKSEFKRPGSTVCFSTNEDGNDDNISSKSKLTIHSIAENSSGAEKNTNELLQEIQDLKDQLEKSRISYEDEIQELEKELMCVKLDVGKFIDRESEYETRIKSAVAEKDALKKDVEQMKAQMQGMKTQMVESKRNFFQHLTGRNQVEQVGQTMRRLSMSSVSQIRKRSSLFNVEFSRRTSCGSGVSSVSSSKSGDANIAGRRPSLLDLLFYVPFDDKTPNCSGDSTPSSPPEERPSWRRILPLGRRRNNMQQQNKQDNVPNERNGPLKSLGNVFRAKNQIIDRDGDDQKKNETETTTA